MNINHIHAVVRRICLFCHCFVVFFDAAPTMSHCDCMSIVVSMDPPCMVGTKFSCNLEDDAFFTTLHDHYYDGSRVRDKTRPAMTSQCCRLRRRFHQRLLQAGYGKSQM